MSDLAVIILHKPALELEYRFLSGRFWKMYVLQYELKGTCAFNALLMLHSAYSRGGSFPNSARKSEVFISDFNSGRDEMSGWQLISENCSLLAE